MRLFYALCFIFALSASACREVKTANDEGIDIKEYESKLDQADELSDKEQEFRQLELDLRQKEEELSRQVKSIPEPQIIEPKIIEPKIIEPKIIEPERPRATTSGRFTGDYPEASKQLLTANDLRYTSKEVLVIMRNEIFARHGYIFKRADLHNHFAKKSWYNPQHSDISHLLTQVEKDNIRLIKAFEDL